MLSAALSALGRRIPAVARHQSMGTIMCALVAHDWVQRRNADTCAKVFLASPNPAAAMLRSEYRAIAPDSKLLEFVEGVAGRLAACVAGSWLSPTLRRLFSRRCV